VSGIEWHASLDAALAPARAGQRPLLVDFWHDT
jgi:hypothetical protein